jgi:hypothetical protein
MIAYFGVFVNSCDISIYRVDANVKTCYYLQVIYFAEIIKEFVV